MSNFVSDKLYSYQRAAVRKIERVFEISQTVGLSETSLSNSTTRLHGKTWSNGTCLVESLAHLLRKETLSSPAGYDRAVDVLRWSTGTLDRLRRESVLIKKYVAAPRCFTTRKWSYNASQYKSRRPKLAAGCPPTRKHEQISQRGKKLEFFDSRRPAKDDRLRSPGAHVHRNTLRLCACCMIQSLSLSLTWVGYT